MSCLFGTKGKPANNQATSHVHALPNYKNRCSSRLTDQLQQFFYDLAIAGQVFHTIYVNKHDLGNACASSAAASLQALICMYKLL